jgi:hypothetical protein
MLCNKVESQIANSMAINIYGSLLKQKNLYTSEAETYINLYSTLRCYGAHLVKDIWPLFYDFIENKLCQSLIFTKAELLDVVFHKL